MLLLQSPVRTVLEEMITYTGKKEDYVDMEQAYEKFMMDPRSGKRFDKRAFRQAFRMMVNHARPNCFVENYFGTVTKKSRAQFWAFKTSGGERGFC